MSAEAALHWAGQTGAWVAALLGLVLLIRRPFAKAFGAQATYWLWALPAIRLLMPELRVLPAPDAPTHTVQSPASATMREPNPLFPTDTALATDALQGMVPTLLALWAGGAVLWFAHTHFRHQRFRRALVARSRPATDFQPVLQNAAHRAGLRRLPELRLDPDGAGPLVMGLFRPLVVLPANAETRFSPAELRHALLHECAHIRRRDLWAAHAALLFRAANWPNPLVHFAAPAFRADQEAATDAHVLRLSGDAVGYAQTLLNAARHATAGPDALGLTLSSPPHPSLETEP